MKPSAVSTTDTPTLPESSRQIHMRYHGSRRERDDAYVGEIALTWQNGVFVADAPVTGLDRMSASAKAERVFLSLLRLFTEQGRAVNHAGSASYAPKVFAEHPKSEGMTKRALKAAMDTLLMAGKIRIVESGPPSKRRSHLEVTE